MPNRYRANAPRFVDETVDGEALIIDMTNGTYFSATGPSALVWVTVSSGASSVEIAERLSATYGVDTAQALRDVEALIEDFVAEGMLVPRDPSDPPTHAEFADAGGPYDGLTYERFTDLADLILLDPVHDVSATGWPHKADSSAAD